MLAGGGVEGGAPAWRGDQEVAELRSGMHVQKGAGGADVGDFGGQRVVGGFVGVEEGDALGAEADRDFGAEGGARHVGVGGLEEAGARCPDEMMGAEFADAARDDVGRAGEAGGGRAAGLGVEASRGAGLKNLAFGEEDEVVGLEGHIGRPGGENDRATRLGGVPEIGGECCARRVVQRHAGFVDQQDAAFGEQAGGGEGELRLAVGELERWSFGQNGGE